MSDWDPGLYHRFREYREEPFRHITERLTIRADEHLIDLGCGTGEQTVALLTRAPHGLAIGLDSSPAMIERARALAHTQALHIRSRLEFRLGDIGTWRDRDTHTLVFSNAALHWVADHRGVLAGAFDALRPGGRLVVQMPRNHGAPSHRLLHDLAGSDRFRSHLNHPVRPPNPVAEPPVYSACLQEIGFADIDVYDIVFQHRLDGPAEVVEWMKGTGLRPFLAALPAIHHSAFLDAYLAGLASAYGTAPFDFEFRRIFLWALRP